MLDLPELFAPARIVNGRISMLCSGFMDLKPPTVKRVIPSLLFAVVCLFGFCSAMIAYPLSAAHKSISGDCHLQFYHTTIHRSAQVKQPYFFAPRATLH